MIPLSFLVLDCLFRALERSKFFKFSHAFFRMPVHLSLHRVYHYDQRPQHIKFPPLLFLARE